MSILKFATGHHSCFSIFTMLSVWSAAI